MHPIYLILLCLIAWPSILLAADHYAEPGGSGSACSKANPCTLGTALAQAGPGDDVILKNGIYRGGMKTGRSGASGKPLTIRAENRHKAIIQQAKKAVNIDILHSHIILRSIKIDGTKNSRDNIRILGAAGKTSIQNVVIEGNWVVNSGHAQLFVGSATRVVVRHNLMENSGLASQGEAIYLSSANSNRPVTNSEIYGNTFRNFTNNAVDYKGQASNINVHHNIFENHRRNWEGFGGDGLVRSEGGSSSRAGNYFRDNIVRYAPHVSYTIRLTPNRVDVLDNVFVNTGGSAFIYKGTTSHAVIRGNTLCNSPTGGDRGGNKHNQSIGVCNNEIDRIMAEMKKLPGQDEDPPPPPPPPLPPPPPVPFACDDMTEIIVSSEPPDADTVSVKTVRASVDDGKNRAEATVDGDFQTYWAGDGIGAWIEYDMDIPVIVSHIGLAWHHGAARQACFSVQISDDSTTWVDLAKTKTSGTTTTMEYYELPEDMGRYVRVVGYGNSINEWNSILETVIYGRVEDERLPPESTVIGWCECGCAALDDGITEEEPAALPGVTRCHGGCAVCEGGKEPVAIDAGVDIGPK